MIKMYWKWRCLVHFKIFLNGIIHRFCHFVKNMKTKCSNIINRRVDVHEMSWSKPGWHHLNKQLCARFVSQKKNRYSGVIQPPAITTLAITSFNVDDNTVIIHCRLSFSEDICLNFHHKNDVFVSCLLCWAFLIRVNLFTVCIHSIFLFYFLFYILTIDYAWKVQFLFMLSKNFIV